MKNWKGSSMKYQDLGGPTPFNYRPDDDSAKLKIISPLVSKKMDMVAKLFREHRTKHELNKILCSAIKKQRSRKVRSKSDELVVDPSSLSDTKKDEDDRFISFGGITDFHEGKKTWSELQMDIKSAKKQMP